ncbi:MAG: hypothetical protein M1819_004535 [Sarea resinae]|nr:MAG: hypothetical protein M1819_004535 [Sarea resinae]
MGFLETATDGIRSLTMQVASTPPSILLLVAVLFIVASLAAVRLSSSTHPGTYMVEQTNALLIPKLYLTLYLVAPVPRSPLPTEKTFRTILPSGAVSDPKPLPCWQDKHLASHEALRQRRRQQSSNADDDDLVELEEPEVFVSVVVPAYNEEKRLGGMLEEAVDYLQREFGDSHSGEGGESVLNPAGQPKQQQNGNGNGNGNGGSKKKKSKSKSTTPNGKTPPTSASKPTHPTGWEILIVSDGSTDATEQTALSFARTHQLSLHPPPVPGPRTPHPTHSTHIPHGSIRVIRLASNRGKGGAVTHGLRHVRGAYVLFADADGATRFSDLGPLLHMATAVCASDAHQRAVVVGSRAHLVGTTAVVKRSFIRNLLMHSFHLLLRLLTPPRTGRIKDTQCGFKLFSRAALADIIPYMHSEGWIFDVEMLMLAESAGVGVVEVPVAWREVGGSKLSVLWDSLGMAWGLGVLRLAWGLGVYRRS